MIQFIQEFALSRFIRNNRRMLQKTATYYVMHITVAAAVAYAVTGDWVMAFTLSLLEPTVQAVAFFVHEKLWSRASVPTPAATATARA